MRRVNYKNKYKSDNRKYLHRFFLNLNFKNSKNILSTKEREIYLGSIKISPLFHAVILIVIWTALRFVLFSVLGNIWFGLTHNTMQVFPTLEFALFMVLILIVGSIGLVYLGLFKWGNITFQDVGWSCKKLGRSIALGVIGLIIAIFIILLFYSIGTISELTISFTPNINILEIFIAILMGFAIAAWIEQSLLPGYLQPILIEKKGLWVGVFIQSVMWPLSHIGWFTTLEDYLMGLVFGILFGLLRGRNNSLIAGTLIHGSMWVLISIIT